MSEYIKREVMLEILEDHPAGTWRGCDVYSDDIRAIMREVDKLPAADVAPVRRGHWERHRAIVQCSCCGFGMFPIAYAFDRGDCVGTNVIPEHCPKCGAILEVDT